MRIALTYNLRRSDDESEAELETQASVDVIRATIASLGHDVVPLCVDGSVAALAARLELLAPDLVFNIAEGRVGKFREAFYPALFEQLGLAFTGSDAGTLSITLDKALTKRLVDGVVDVPRLNPSAGLAIVKPNHEGSSKGITQRSIVDVGDAAACSAVLADVSARYPAGVIVEEFVDGLDVTVAWLERLGALAPAIYRYDTRPGEHRLFERRLKGKDEASVAVEVPATRSLPSSAVAAAQAATAAVMQALGVRDIGRADFRYDEKSGRLVFLEVNALPAMNPELDHEIFRAAPFAGPADVFGAIIETAVVRRRRNAAQPVLPVVKRVV